MNYIYILIFFCCSTCFAEDSLDIRIPVVSMNDFYDLNNRDAFLNTLHTAMSEIGFFAVRNSGVNAKTIQSAYKASEQFFKQDLAKKLLCQTRNTKGQRGFIASETAKGNAVKDFKEYYHIGRELISLPANIWPDQPGFQTSLTALYTELNQYVVPLQEAIMMTINKNAPLKLPENLLDTMTREGDTLLRALYYPALTDEQLENKELPHTWASEHTDIDLLTILPYATTKGLQIQLKGQWLNVIVPEDAFVINVGDMLENLTNGLFKSARHRVLAQEPNKDRFSMVLFVHPVNDADLTPLPSCISQTGGIQRYAPGTRKEFLWERLLELGIAPGLLEEYAKTGHTERQMMYGRQSPQVIEMLSSRNVK